MGLFGKQRGGDAPSEPVPPAPPTSAGGMTYDSFIVELSRRVGEPAPPEAVRTALTAIGVFWAPNADTDPSGALMPIDFALRGYRAGGEVSFEPDSGEAAISREHWDRAVARLRALGATEQVAETVARAMTFSSRLDRLMSGPSWATFSAARTERLRDAASSAPPEQREAMVRTTTDWFDTGVALRYVMQGQS